VAAGATSVTMGYTMLSDWWGIIAMDLVAGGTDTVAPSVPTGLTVTGTTTSSVSLSWTASTDNVGVAGYKIYRNGTQVGTATGTTYTDTGLGSSTSYTYTVSAYDAAGNNSAQSAAVIGTTQTPQAGPVITSFTANPTSIGTGGSSTLSWSVSGNPA